MRGCNDSKNAKYRMHCLSLHVSTFIFSTLCPHLHDMPIPAIIKVHNYPRYKWQCSDSTIHTSPGTNTTPISGSQSLKQACMFSFVCQVTFKYSFWKQTVHSQAIFFHQHHKNSGRTLKPTLEMHSASSRLFATHFPILVLEISKKQTSLLYRLDWQTQRSLNAELT